MFERYGRWAWLGAIPLILIGSADLATGDLTGDRRADVATLAGGAMILYSSFSLRRLARRFREPMQPTRASARMVARGIASLVFALALSFGLGYLVGGLVFAVVLVAGSVVLMLFSVWLGLRKRRVRERAAAEARELFDP
jgi:hypothetical protein